MNNPISTVLKSLFGSISWSSPSWLNKLREKARTAPKKFWSTVVISLFLVTALIDTGIWYKNLPKPQYITAQISAPNITPNEETLVPGNLIIDFGIKNNEFTAQSVAPINNIGKKVTEGFSINPAIAGQWMWNTDSQLIFTPDEDWPAGQKYSISFSKDFFAAHTNMGSYHFEFSTQEFTAKIGEFKLYQDPVNSEIKYSVATIEFNFPVNTTSLEKNTQLVYETIKNGSLDKNAESLAFTYTYDAHKRVAYLHSAPIQIKDKARFLRLQLNKNIQSSTNSGALSESLSKNMLIPDSSNFMKIVSAGASIIRNNQDRPEQVVTIETTLGVNDQEFNKHVHIYVLPKDYPASKVEAAKPNYQWQNPGEVTDAILALSSPLEKQAIPNEFNYSSLHSFKFVTATPRYLFIKIDKGLKGFGDFNLSTEYTGVITVPELPKEISFLHKGSLLALSGEKKLSVLVRGLPAVRFDFARVLPDNVNQLVTQTHGDFNNPYFNNPSFNQQNISQIFTDTQEFDANDPSKQHYTALDVGKYLAQNSSGLGPKGLFLIQATGWDLQNKTALDVKSSRLILVTDLGLLVKDNKDGSHDVFVQSITQGVPVAGVNVSILGKNSLPILTRMTDAQGRVTFPNLKDFIEDREPTVYLANLNDDVSFIPFANSNRQLNFSKFDIGGLYTNDQELHNLSAYLFSDRGIYRPGDTAHIGMIVKQDYAQAQAAGLPLQASITDARGATIKDQKLTLNETGYMELDLPTNVQSPTGQYQVNLYLVKDDHPQNLLGSTTIKLAEFQPDRMRISSNLFPKPADGWNSPIGLKAQVSLWNLYGAPATDRRISGRILLTPEEIEFSDYADYVFADPLKNPKKPAKVYSETLSDLKTNDKGQVEFDLNLDRFEKATYQMTFFAEGFEAEGGRSVSTQVKALISPLPYFVGYKADGDLNFIKQNSTRSLHYIALNPQVEKQKVQDLKIQLISLHPVTTLVKKDNGTYQYQSIIQSSIVSSQAFEISEQGTSYNLPTQEIGDYTLSILDKNNTVLSQSKFSIVGASQKPLAKNAELAIKLNKTEYQPNETIEIQITAPYTGSGLITIERDKVFASSWFKSETSNSMQTIQIPADFKGNGYINVAFIRDWESPELFISPLSYSVVPFTVNHDSHAIKIDLQTPKVVRPGDDLTINYQSDKPGKIIVFAVDEGILQVARYETPDPLAFFFQKRALEVNTQQTVDQILPKFIQDRELSAAGGDDGEAGFAGHLNPFKRKTDLPVVFWSGIIDTDNTSRQLNYKIPDYFNGSLKVMAVAVAADAVGAGETESEVRGDFIINPNVPSFASPGDEFEVSASIANNIKDSGDHAPVQVELESSNQLELIDTKKQNLEIAEGREQTVRFKVRAKSILGSAQLTFKVQSGTKIGSINSTLSIRPSNPFSTFLTSGMTSDATKSLTLIQTLFPEYRTSEIIMSPSPLILVFGLQRYLKNFPFVCTEQLISKSFPLLAMDAQGWFNKTDYKIDESINASLQMLSQRQMSNGGFSYWPGLADNQNNTFASVYAMHFLIEAKAQGIPVSDELFYKGIAFLKDLAGQNPTSLDSARIQAYAIYLLTRIELVTSNYLAHLQMYLQQDKSHAWHKDLTAVYIAASYQMLKSYEDAEQLISLYRPQANQNTNTDFYNSTIADAQYLYILAKHFPEKLPKLGDKLVLNLVAAMNNDQIDTLLAGYTSLALIAYSPNVNTSSFSITQHFADKQQKTISADMKQNIKLDLDTSVQSISLNNPDKKPLFYQLIQAGFDKTVPTEAIKQGMEIFKEFRDAKGNVITDTSLGSELEVHIHIRALNNAYLNNISIVDLLPGGFEVVIDSVKIDGMEYVAVREDRIIYFGPVDSSTKELVYKIKATNTGTFTVPPAYAQAMYNPGIIARGTASSIKVS
ncbi:MAG: alpha-2-macroglobulin [Legionella sp.]|jgi:hypothetical protein